MAYDPIEILPYGRSEDDQRKIDRDKARAGRAVKIFALEVIAVCLLIIWASLHAASTLR